MTPFEFALAATALLIGACIQGSLGFGLGLVGAPMLVIIDPTLVPSVVLAVGTPLTYLVAYRERKALDVRPVSWAIGGRIPGTVLGTMAVVAFGTSTLAALFAGSVLLAVVLSVIGLSVEPSRGSLLTAGFFSGLMGTATSVGGPPMALLFQRREGPELRASLAAFMAFGATLSIAVLAIAGQFEGRHVKVTLALAPAVLLGFVLSSWTNRFLDRGHTRQAVLIFATLSALSILVRQVW
ncbi:MAG: sulfite exporter TauE/SafE family protein [Ilumatobacter fluminis]|uniref:sulfite exporter TauE/SafE family protein n=1 Tax=Ilumatobacter fluminis TaxID=467091 RepID=UPI0032EEAFD8